MVQYLKGDEGKDWIRGSFFSYWIITKKKGEFISSSLPRHAGGNRS
jgi:hypothetical protein